MKTPNPEQIDPTPEPVKVSGEATRAIAAKVREWSGWPDAKFTWGMPHRQSPYAATDIEGRAFIVNPDALVMNPNRVLLTVTPFRLRQEAVLTGALLHEAGHARHSHWLDSEPIHSDGVLANRQTLALARLMEEPRVEGLMARDADTIGATGLGWTMRACAAALIPTTRLTMNDPDQQVMDMIESWAKRAGRQLALANYTSHRVPTWATDFTTLLHKVLVAHLSTVMDEGQDPAIAAHDVLTDLFAMAVCADDRGPTMIDTAREILRTLFPETDGDSDDAPMPSEGCHGGAGEEGEPEDSESEEGEEQAGGQPEEAPEDDAGEDESDEQGSGEDEDQPEESEPESGAEDGEPEPDDKGEDEADSDEGEAEAEPDPLAEELAKALAELEAASQTEAETEAKDEAAKPPPREDSAKGAGAGKGGGDGEWREPTKEEREIAKGAERFLRDMIAPVESNKISLVESPSATVDGAALAAWKAGGEVRDPMFFKRTRREVQPSPPVQIAVLVDVSGSMDELQAPSAVLSWALTSAALDLRNFAGRGQQIESTLIHWGSGARVIQRNGETLPGIREFPCNEGTVAMDAACKLVEEQIPGFFSVSDKPVHRLLVQFTDWELWNEGTMRATPWIQKAMAAGVNMVNIVPTDYHPRGSALSTIMAQCKVQRGLSTLMKYSPRNPGAVWTEAAKALR